MDPIVIAAITGALMLTLGLLSGHRRHRRLSIREKRLASAFHRAKTSRMHGAGMTPNLYVDQSS